MPDNDSPTLGPIRQALGEERLERFVVGHGKLQAMTLCLVMSAMTVPRADYSDEALVAMKQDAIDVRDAADAWARSCEDLAEVWREQREATTT